MPRRRCEELLLQRSCGGAMVCTTEVTDSGTIEDLSHHLCFATAAYGWLMHLYCGKGSPAGLPSRAALRRRQFRQDLDRRAIETALKNWPGHAASKLVYLSSYATKKMPAYAVFVDPVMRNVVVSVRGTLSVSDAITDVIADPRPICDSSITGPEPGPHFVHGGFWDAAVNIMTDINQRGILESLYCSGSATKRQEYALLHECDCQGFGLVVVGHSLGAGVAQLLCAALSQSYPGVRSLAYAAPHVCSEAFASHLGQRNISVVLGDDVIPRLSVRNAEFLRDVMVCLVARCPLPKWKMFSHGLRRDWSDLWASGKMCANDIVSDEARERSAKFLGRTASPRFWHAGRVLYLRVTETAAYCCGTFVRDVGYRAEWAQSDDLMEILVSRRMFLHHMPDQYRAAFDNLLEPSCVGTGQGLHAKCVGVKLEEQDV